MLRVGELVLAVAPLVAFLILYMLLFRGRGISRGTVLVASAMVLGFGVWLVWMGTSERLDRGEAYVPATLRNGAIVQGHGAGEP